MEEILKKVKADLAVFGNDEDIREFGEALLGGKEEKEAARPSSPSSTPHVRARALEPGLLPSNHHRVVH